jgi:hypothetical protein
LDPRREKDWSHNKRCWVLDMYNSEYMKLLVYWQQNKNILDLYMLYWFQTEECNWHNQSLKNLKMHTYVYPNNIPIRHIHLQTIHKRKLYWAEHNNKIHLPVM